MNSELKKNIFDYLNKDILENIFSLVDDTTKTIIFGVCKSIQKYTCLNNIFITYENVIATRNCACMKILKEQKYHLNLTKEFQNIIGTDNHNFIVTALDNTNFIHLSIKHVKEIIKSCQPKTILYLCKDIDLTKYFVELIKYEKHSIILDMYYLSDNPYEFGMSIVNIQTPKLFLKINDKEFLEFLIDNGIQLVAFHLTMSIKRKSLDIVKLVIENISKDELQKAIHHIKSLDIVKLVIENISKDELQKAIHHIKTLDNHIPNQEIATWLIDNDYLLKTEIVTLPNNNADTQYISETMECFTLTLDIFFLKHLDTPSFDSILTQSENFHDKHIRLSTFLKYRNKKKSSDWKKIINCGFLNTMTNEEYKTIALTNDIELLTEPMLFSNPLIKQNIIQYSNNDTIIQIYDKDNNIEDVDDHSFFMKYILKFRDLQILKFFINKGCRLPNDCVYYAFQNCNKAAEYVSKITNIECMFWHYPIDKTKRYNDSEVETLENFSNWIVESRPEPQNFRIYDAIKMNNLVFVKYLTEEYNQTITKKYLNNMSSENVNKNIINYFTTHSKFVQ